ncbi:MAG: hypothetical protein ACSLE6_02770 [Mycobacterium sp.]
MLYWSSEGQRTADVLLDLWVRIAGLGGLLTRITALDVQARRAVRVWA